MSPGVLGIGVALPAVSVTQGQSLALARELVPMNDHDDARRERVYRQAGVEKRGSVVAEGEAGDGEAIAQSFFKAASAGDPHGPTTGARMRRYAEHAPRLAIHAARRAIEHAQVGEAEVQDIRHLITASCTGLMAPGIDAELVHRLNLRGDVSRTHIGFMGCHAAINALRVSASALEGDDRGLALLVCVELCSLHFQYAHRPDLVVANALFADGAAAVLLGATDRKRGGDRAGIGGGSQMMLASTSSRLIPATTDLMSWTIGDHGFEMGLSPQVPGTIGNHIRAWAGEWLGGVMPGRALADFDWAIHPGGPRVIDAVRDALELPEAAMAVSRCVLREHGNMSSPTVLVIAERLRRGGSGKPIVALAFGPGLTAEGALFVME